MKLPSGHNRRRETHGVEITDTVERENMFHVPALSERLQSHGGHSFSDSPREVS